MKRTRGHSVIEVALLAPWIFFLFVGLFDFGFYAYALICVENAARVAVMYTSDGTNSAGDSAIACQYALGELTMLPNLKTAIACGGPLSVTAQSVTGADGHAASTVSVRYQTIPMIPIPGLLAGQMTITRTVQMRLRNT